MTLHVDLLNYGVGNLHSIRKALERSGALVSVRSPEEGLRGQAVVLPGVGAFGEASRRLAPVKKELVGFIESGGPVLGVCLGLQLFFRSSEESPGEGLGIVRGAVRRLPARKLPQIGWNEVELGKDGLWEGFPSGSHVYFVNSFAPVPEEEVSIAWAQYGGRFTAAVRKLNAWGVQFHPEKSGEAGVRVIGNFVKLAKEMTS